MFKVQCLSGCIYSYALRFDIPVTATHDARGHLVWTLLGMAMVWHGIIFILRSLITFKVQCPDSPPALLHVVHAHVFTQSTVFFFSNRKKMYTTLGVVGTHFHLLAPPRTISLVPNILLYQSKCTACSSKNGVDFFLRPSLKFDGIDAPFITWYAST